MKGKRVVTAEGKVLGRVKEIKRSGNSNKVQEIIIKKTFSKEFSIPVNHIEFVAKSVMLKKSYSQS
jgi:sporulation protein YlmC with PRC-barrel domain